MPIPQQHTTAGEIEIGGVGVHSGAQARLRIMPAPVETGIRFRRIDIAGAPEIPADLDHVTGTELGTNVGAGDAEVATVEHVLAALAAFGVQNARLDLHGPEVPILDGSFAPWLDALQRTGRKRQDAAAAVVRVTEPITLGDGAKATYTALPHDRLRVSATIDFAHPVVGRQHGDFRVSASAFRADIAPARTFGFLADAPALRARGLAAGASLENTVVIGDEEVLNDQLRYPDEFLRHKVGDLLGDLALLGARLQGHVVASCPSHAGNVKLARAIRTCHDRERRRCMIGIDKITEYLPHRYPMLLVDRVVEYEPGSRIVGLKNVTINEPFFRGHFPGHPVMPGVLVIEAMAQVGGLLLMDSVEDPAGKVVYFMSLNNVKWRRPVVPGDQVVFEMEIVNQRRRVCRMRGKGTVDRKVVAEAEMTARIVDR